MTTSVTAAGRSHRLEGAALRVPELQPEPFALRSIRPSPCTQACPAGVNVKAYVSLIAEGRFSEALGVVRERCPLPGICGRICHHPCEAACERSGSGGPIAIRALKRFVADLELDPPEISVPPLTSTQRIAVVGSGPAGLTAAYDLRLAGYRVTVFEAEAEPGGMLRYGIADYRLPIEVLDAEISGLERSGIEIRTGCRVGEDHQLEELLADGYSAVLVAIGTQKGRPLAIEGAARCAEVQDALEFLRRVNRGDRTSLAGNVLVIGGGSTAIEAARSAQRLGASSVEIVYRRQRGEMPADDEEIDQAAAEGIRYRFLTAPARVITQEGRLATLECVQVALGEPDASGRRRPIEIPGSEFGVPADRVLTALGLDAELALLPEKLRHRSAARGLLSVDPATWMTGLAGVFAAGDVVTGPRSVIEAIAAGHEAAERIHAFLEPALQSGSERSRGSSAAPEHEIVSASPVAAPRRDPPQAEISPGHEFEEVERAYSRADAVSEARRCLRCGPCSECRICATSCDRRHVWLQLGGEEERVAKLLRAPAWVSIGVELGPRGSRLAAGRVRSVGSSSLLIKGEPGCATGVAVDLLPTGVTIDGEYCRGCARCLEVCPFEALGWVDASADEPSVEVHTAFCRGCNLCAAVCPTDAVTPSAPAPEWWGSRPADPHRLIGAAPRPSVVVLACQRRAPEVESSLERCRVDGLGAQLVPVRCAGQLEAGTLLEIYRQGAGRVVVAGCVGGSCRYGHGSLLAAEQVAKARAVLEMLGTDPHRVVADWAEAGGKESLRTLIPDLLADSRRPAGAAATAGRET